MPPQNFQVPPPPPPGGPPQSLAGGDEGPQTQVVQGFPETRVGRIIGPGGSMIKQIKDDTGAHVSVARERIPGTADVPVTVVGTQAQITKALETMAALIRGNDEKRSDGMAHIVHEHPKEHCKAVIGSRGATITALRDASGCSIKVSDALLFGTANQTITYTGTEGQVEKAIEMVRELLTTGQLPAAARSAMPRGPQDGPVGEGEKELVLQINEMYAGKIIGRAGQVVKTLSERSGASIEVATECLPGQSLVKEVAFRGSEAAVDVAVAMVNAVLSTPDGGEMATAVNFPVPGMPGMPMPAAAAAPVHPQQAAYAPPPQLAAVPHLNPNFPPDHPLASQPPLPPLPDIMAQQSEVLRQIDHMMRVNLQLQQQMGLAPPNATIEPMPQPQPAGQPAQPQTSQS
jgi:poly(rC)-binding protein 2/3/4